MVRKVENQVRPGTDNVFADLGYSDAGTHLLKAQLVSRMQDVIDAQRLTQAEAAEIMRVSQPDVSRLMNGRFRDVSVERLMRLLTKLGCEVDIVVKPKEKGKAFAAIRL